MYPLSLQLVFSLTMFTSKLCRICMKHSLHACYVICQSCCQSFNPLNAELNPICYLLALLGAHHFLHVSRIRVKHIIKTKEKNINLKLLNKQIFSSYSYFLFLRCRYSRISVPQIMILTMVCDHSRDTNFGDRQSQANEAASFDVRRSVRHHTIQIN